MPGFTNLSDFNLLTPTKAGKAGAEATLGADKEAAKKIQQRDLIADYMRLAETPITPADKGMDKGDALRIGIGTALGALLAGVAGGKKANFGNILASGVSSGLQTYGMQAKTVAEQAQVADALAVEDKKNKLAALKLQIDTNENTANRFANLATSNNADLIPLFMQPALSPVDVKEALVSKGIARDRAEAIDNAYKFIAQMPNGASKAKAMTALNAILPKQEDGTPAIPQGVVDAMGQQAFQLTVQDMLQEFGPASVDAIEAYLGNLKLPPQEQKPLEYFLSLVNWAGYKAQQEAKNAGDKSGIDETMKLEGWRLVNELDRAQRDPALTDLSLEETMKALGWTDAQKLLFQKVLPKAAFGDMAKYLAGVGRLTALEGNFEGMGKESGDRITEFNAMFEAEQKQEQERVNQHFIQQHVDATLAVKRDNPNWFILSDAEKEKLVLEYLGWNVRQINQFRNAVTGPDTTKAAKAGK